jgi:type IV pilus assembly protein PilW
MIGITIGLLVLAATTTLFVANSRARQEREKTSQQIENGRYASQLLTGDLRLTGYYGEFSPTVLATPATLPDPSATDVASLTSAMALPIQGYDDGAGLPAGLTTLLTDLRAGTDVLVVRRTSACVAGATGCDAIDTSKYTYFQTTLCQNQISNLPAASQFLIGTTEATFTSSNPAVTGAASPPAFLAKKDCATPAVQRGYYTRIYFVANDNQPGDGIPTLMVAELGAGAFAVSPIVAGIEQLQLEYGLDTDGDGTPDTYTGAPANAGAWRQVTAVKVHVLARNLQTSGGFTDTRTYVLGLNSAGANNVFGPYNDGYKRHAYSTTVRLDDVAGRLE